MFRRWGTVIILFGVLLSCTERRYRENIRVGSLYVESDTAISLKIVKDNDTIFYGKTRTFYRTSYYSPIRYGTFKVYLPTGSGCARSEVSTLNEGCGIIIVPDTPSTYGECPSCDSIATERNTIVDVLTWDRPVAVKVNGKCLQVFESERIYAAYVDSLLPGEYLLVLGSDTVKVETVFVSSEKCARINVGGDL
ncbi:MAG: hypothetical protein GXO39_08140 [Thermotogae bacterium]|nr:hypothetical protein [Thermotogota bacterium]